MNRTSPYIALISGQRTGLLAALARAGLRLLATGYAGLISLRNTYYDRWSMPTWLDAPVISVGNLTVGGTGKTPMTVHLCRELLRRDRKPAVLSRGYKADREADADEAMLVGRRCPEAVAIANPDRVAAGRLAIEQYAVTAIVLDDGFQHRRVGRDLDLVLIDATCPFGFDAILPRGLLREPVASLCRAHAVILTRSDQCPPPVRAEIERRITALHPTIPILRARHRPTGFTDLAGSDVPPPEPRRIGVFAGIARPDAFAETLHEMGHPPIATQWWPDHHAYTTGDVAALAKRVADENLTSLVTTEKDAVKLAALGADWPVPVKVLRVEIQLLDDGPRVLGDLIDAMLRDHRTT